jgi:hypothetical protein
MWNGLRESFRKHSKNWKTINGGHIADKRPNRSQPLARLQLIPVTLKKI